MIGSTITTAVAVHIGLHTYNHNPEQCDVDKYTGVWVVLTLLEISDQQKI